MILVNQTIDLILGLDPKISSKLHSVFFWKKELIRDRDKERREKNNKFVFKKYRMINQIIIKVAWGNNHSLGIIH